MKNAFPILIAEDNPVSRKLTDYGRAMSSAARLRWIVSESVSSYNGIEIHITASFGVAGFVPSANNQKMPYEVIIDRGDKALYRAKNARRNRVMGEALKG